jgi:tetratricopeptide (TPR) repeat protein
MGEGLEELTIQRLSSAGQQVYSHSGRLNEMDRYGLPAAANLSHATMLHIAEELDADFVIFGKFASDGKNLTIEARVLRVNYEALLPPLQESGPLELLMDIHTRLMWRILGANDHAYPMNLAEFTKLQRPLRLDAFEQYIRGLVSNEDEIRLRDLKEAARLEPEWPEPAFALGEFYFAKNDCPSAMPWFARVPPSHDRSVEAIFATGVCYLQMNQPQRAEDVFTSLQKGLQHNMVSGADLPEILNNLALAHARAGNSATAQTALSRAAGIDPDEDDYPFNSGLLSLEQKDYAAAAGHFREAFRREPDNAEDLAFLIYGLDKGAKKSEADGERENAVQAFGPNGLPLLKVDAKTDSLAKYQRVKRELDITSLRLELQDPNAQHAENSVLATEKDSSAAHIRRGRQSMGAGRLDAAEQEFRAALAVDPHDASAHRELADVYRRHGKLDDAVHELQQSLAARDSAATRTTLARVYLEQKKPELARAEVEKAVKLAPNYTEAKTLLEHMGKSSPPGAATGVAK